MKKLLSHRFQLIGVTLLACGSLAGMAFAEDNNSAMRLSKETPRGVFVVLQPHLHPGERHRQRQKPPQTPLPTWNGSFNYNGTNYPYNMVGANPSTNSSTTVTAYVIPIKIVVTRRRTKYTFDPSHVLANGKTVINNTVTSPIFDSTTKYDQGGTNVGTTQYIDAFQRANFWGTVENNQNYHLLLGGPTVLAEQTLNVPSFYGTVGSPFGHTAGEVDINYFDAQLQSIISKFSQIQPNTFPIFLAYDVYLTQGGQCCIGGYHSSEGSLNNPQAYAYFTYVDHPGDFAQDVSALSHEAGEWADDPLVVNTNGNNTPCGILEVGDPEEGFANYGAFHYILNGFTYNLQDLVTLPYFGAPTNTSVNGWLSFQGNSSLSVCSNGP